MGAGVPCVRVGCLVKLAMWRVEEVVHDHGGLGGLEVVLWLALLLEGKVLDLAYADGRDLLDVAVP